MSQISRSQYQKVVEENKRLKSNIKILVAEGLPTAKKILLISEWRDKFSKEEKFWDDIKTLLSVKKMDLLKNDEIYNESDTEKYIKGMSDVTDEDLKKRYK